jgi:hypothetical protein
MSNLKINQVKEIEYNGDTLTIETEPQIIGDNLNYVETPF